MRYFLDQIILWACLEGGYLKLIDFGRPSPAHVTPLSWLGMRDLSCVRVEKLSKKTSQMHFIRVLDYRYDLT